MPPIPDSPQVTQIPFLWLQNKIPVSWPFKKNVVFVSSRFHLSLADKCPTDFQGWMLHGQLFLALDWGAQPGIQPHFSQGKLPQLLQPRYISTAPSLLPLGTGPALS